MTGDAASGSRYPFTPYPAGWFRIAWSHDLAVSSVLPLRCFGRDLVLFRTTSGHPCLLDAHCPHVGAHLGHGGRVVGEAIQCPFHGWTMDCTGQCIAIPYSTRIPERARVNAWPVCEKNGVIMAWYGLPEQAPDWDVPGLPEHGSNEWTPFRCGASWRIRVHLQDLGENGVDKAHFPYLHTQQTRSMESLGVEEDGVTFVHRTFQHYNVFGLARLLVDDVCGPLDVIMHGMGMAVNRTVVQARIRLHYTFVFYFTPVDGEFTDVTCMLSMKKTGAALIDHLLLSKAIREGQHTIDQDVPIWENKVYRDKPLLCDGDGPIMQFRRWARRFYPHEVASR